VFGQYQEVRIKLIVLIITVDLYSEKISNWLLSAPVVVGKGFTVIFEGSQRKNIALRLIICLTLLIAFLSCISILLFLINWQ